MSIRDKLFLIGAFVFVILVMVFMFRTKDCDKEWSKIDKKLDYIKSDNSIKSIRLFKAYPNSVTNLVADTFVVVDKSTIEFIRQKINSRKTGTWNHPMAEWDVAMRMTLSNDETFDLRISKIKNDKEKEMTHIDYGTEYCRDNLPNCSLTLGTYLEQLTNYKGRPY